MRALRTGAGEVVLPRTLWETESLGREEPPPLPDPAGALRAALEAPVEGPPLSAFLEGRRTVAVVLPDATRPMPAELVEALLDAAGANPARRLFVRIANGTHRRSRPEEQQRLLGRHFGKVEAGDRSAEDPSAHRPAGAPPGQAVEPRLDAALAEADAVVMMGPASFHYLAGFGGGGKLLAPGLADRATAEWVHAACLAPEGGRSPRAIAGMLEGNPLRERIEAVAAKAPPQFLVVPVLDSRGRTAALFAGERRACFARACESLRSAYSVPARPRATVVASAGGAPYDADFVQGHKALESAAAVCRPGGTLVLVARCAEGLPARHQAFLERHPTAAQMERALRERFDIAGHTVWAARWKAERFDIRMVTEMDPALVARLGMTPAASLDEALRGVSLEDAVVMPYGARFLPVLTTRGTSTSPRR